MIVYTSEENSGFDEEFRIYETETSNNIEFGLNYIKKLPIPLGSTVLKEKISGIVDKIIEHKKRNLDSKSLENEIDEIVFELYGITEEEMGVLLISQSGETRDILIHIKDICLITFIISLKLKVEI